MIAVKQHGFAQRLEAIPLNLTTETSGVHSCGITIHLQLRFEVVRSGFIKTDIPDFQQCSEFASDRSENHSN